MTKPRRLDRAELLVRLAAAATTPELVRVARHRMEKRDAFTTGYLVGHGARYILLHLLGDDLDLDGYRALRIKHLTGFETDFPKKAFYLKALARKQQGPGVPSGIDLDTTASLLRSVDERYPLVTVHRERIHARACEIGRIRALFGKSYLLHWINPDATWEVDDRRFRYSDVSMVEFDRGYENTLALVSGASPGMVLPERPAPTPHEPDDEPPTQA